MSSEEVDAVLSRLGGYGRYQWLLIFAMGLIDLVNSLHTFILIFMVWTPEHHCTPRANQTLNQSLPWEENGSGESYVCDRAREILMAWSQCSMYKEAGSEGGLHGNTTVSCQHGWTYVWDRDGETSVVSEWDLVCDQGYVSELSVTALMVGSACGTFFLTPLPDRWGRKIVLMGCLLLQTVVGVATAFTQGPVAFVILQFFQGAFHTVSTVCGNLILVETFDKNTRVLPVYSLAFFWTAGPMLMSLIAYFIRQWRHLQLAISLPVVLMVTYYWLVPESLSWLLITGKTERAKKVILTIVRVNKLPEYENLDKTLEPFKEGLLQPREKVISPTETQAGDSTRGMALLPDTEATLDAVSNTNAGQIAGLRSDTNACKTVQDTVLLSDPVAAQETLLPSDATAGKTVQIKNEAETADTASHTVFDLFRTSRIRRYSIIVLYLSFVNSLAYFGISFSMPLLSGDKYINTLISGAVEMPANIAIVLFNERVGRRVPVCVFMMTCAGANIIEIFLPATTESGADLSMVKTAAVMIGKFGITGAYSIMILYGTEVFPTSIRSHAMGLCMFFESFGSIVSPQILYARYRGELNSRILPSLDSRVPDTVCVEFGRYMECSPNRLEISQPSQAKTMTQLPMTLFSVMTLVGTFLIFFLPETHNAPLPQTVRDLEHWDQKRRLKKNSKNEKFSSS